MKKIFALILSLTTIFVSLLSLSSCGDSSDTPEGMQLVYGGKNAGYYFYAPEEWTVSKVGAIKSAYVSRLDTTCVSFSEVTESIKNAGGDEYFFGSYFSDSMKEAPENITVNVTLDGEATVFGKTDYEADKAVKYTYNYKYSGRSFGFMQILIKDSDRYFIFTYRALLEKKDGGKTYYESYLEKLDKVITEFKFTDKEAEKSPDVSYKEDKDGYILISNAKIAGFDLYVPKSFKPDHSDGFVSASHTDGSNVNLTEAFMTGNNVNVKDYFEIRKKELSEFVTDFTEIATFEAIEMKNTRFAFSYEYTYVYAGEKYHVLQIYAVSGPLLSQTGYVFTYTAKEDNYSLHLDEVQTIISKVNFK